MSQNTLRKVCHTPTPGKKSTSITSWKYDLVREAILSIIPTQVPGIAAKELADMVRDKLNDEQLQRLGSVRWYTTTVKLNMEVEGEIKRVPGIKPQRLIKCE